jgi:N-acetylglucosaminyldiphosphoundecaprenol N-acetyl-beta-D-mannosaminyltransferase
MNILNVIKEKISSNAELNMPGISIFLNPFTYLKVRNDVELLHKCDKIFIDGQWLCHFLNWFGVVRVERCSFDNSSAAPIVLTYSNIQKEKLIFVGTDAKSSKKFKEYIDVNYPDIDVLHYRDGYFNSEIEYQETIDLIVDLKPHLIIVGMGFIKQERFLIHAFEKGYKGKAYTCGGFMHQTANKGHNYYPKWVNRFNLRFVYRIWDEPKLIRRYVVDYALFVVMFLKDLMTRSDER